MAYDWNMVLAIANIATLIAIIIYVIKTSEMAKATREYAKISKETLEEMRDTRDQTTAPYIVCYFEFKQNSMYLVVKNIGKGLAENVKIELDPSLINFRGENLSETSIFRHGISSMPPGYEIKTFVDLPFKYFEKKLPLECL